MKSKSGKKKTILVVVRYPIGGIRTYIKYMYGNLNKEQYSFLVLMCPDVENQVVSEDELELDAEIIEIPGKRFFLSFGYKIFLTMLTRRIDLIHSQGSSAGIISSLMNILFRTPHIITLHETFQNNTKNTVGPAKRKLISFLFSRANYLNTLSGDATNNLLAYFPSLSTKDRKIVEIHNGIDIEHFSEEIPDQQSIYNINGIKEGDFIIGFFGRFMPEKGFPILIDAIDLIKKSGRTNKVVRIIALGRGAFYKEYRALIRDKGLNDYFIFIEFQNDLRWLYRQIDLLVIPSFREACPLVPMEGLVSGTPIVASDCLGLREVLKETPARLFQTGNPNELAIAIVDAIHAPMNREAMNFMPIAKGRYDIKKAAGQLEDLFKRALLRP